MLITLFNLYLSTLLNNALPAQTAESPKTEAVQQLEISPQPYKKVQNPAPPQIDAKAIYVEDLKTSVPLYQKNAEDKKAIGSITKLMTVSIVLEENNLNNIATISQRAAGADGSKIWLYPGEKIAVQNLLYAALIPSANDSAYALAEFNGGSVEKFVEKMNKKAEMLGMKNTHFSNPAGFDDPNHYSTAKDLAILSRYAYRKPFIRHAVTIDKMEVTSTDGKIKHKLETTNDLLGKDPRIKGLKTGHTNEAGFSFVSVAQNNYGNDVITVLLDSPSRFKETQKLLDWIFTNYTW